MTLVPVRTIGRVPARAGASCAARGAPAALARSLRATQSSGLSGAQLPRKLGKTSPSPQLQPHPCSCTFCFTADVAWSKRQQRRVPAKCKAWEGATNICSRRAHRAPSSRWRQVVARRAREQPVCSVCICLCGVPRLCVMRCVCVCVCGCRGAWPRLQG